MNTGNSGTAGSNGSYQNDVNNNENDIQTGDEKREDMHPLMYVGRQAAVVLIAIKTCELAVGLLGAPLVSGLTQANQLSILSVVALSSSCLISQRFSRAWNGPLPNGYRGAVRGVPWMMLVIPLAFMVSLSLSQLAPSSEHPAVIKLAMQPTIGTFATLAGAVPVLEELLFRGLIFARIWPAVGLWPAVFITSLLFGIVHAGEGQEKVIAVGLGSIPFSLALAATGRLMAPIILHAATNTLALSLWAMASPTLTDKDDGTDRFSRDTLMKWHIVLRMLNSVASAYVQSTLIKYGVIKPRDAELIDNKGNASPFLKDFMKRVWNDTNQRVLLDRWILASEDTVVPGSAIIAELAEGRVRATSASASASTSTALPTPATESLSTLVGVAGDTLPRTVVRVLSQASVAGQQEAVSPLRDYYRRITDGYRAALLHIYDDNDDSSSAAKVGSAAYTHQPEFDVMMTIIIQAALTQPSAVHSLINMYPTLEADARAATNTPKKIGKTAAAAATKPPTPPSAAPPTPAVAPTITVVPPASAVTVVVPDAVSPSSTSSVVNKK